MVNDGKCTETRQVDEEGLAALARHNGLNECDASKDRSSATLSFTFLNSCPLLQAKPGSDARTHLQVPQAHVRPVRCSNKMIQVQRPNSASSAQRFKQAALLSMPTFTPTCKRQLLYAPLLPVFLSQMRLHSLSARSNTPPTPTKVALDLV